MHGKITTQYTGDETSVQHGSWHEVGGPAHPDDICFNWDGGMKENISCPF